MKKGGTQEGEGGGGVILIRTQRDRKVTGEEGGGERKVSVCVYRERKRKRKCDDDEISSGCPEAMLLDEKKRLTHTGCRKRWVRERKKKSGLKKNKKTAPFFLEKKRNLSTQTISLVWI